MYVCDSACGGEKRYHWNQDSRSDTGNEGEVKIL